MTGRQGQAGTPWFYDAPTLPCGRACFTGTESLLPVDWEEVLYGPYWPGYRGRATVGHRLVYDEHPPHAWCANTPGFEEILTQDECRELCDALMWRNQTSYLTPPTLRPGQHDHIWGMEIRNDVHLLKGNTVFYYINRISYRIEY